jgi:hypothetical protein
MRYQFEQNGSLVSTDLVQNGQQNADDKQHESGEAITVDNHVARDIPSERSVEDGTIVDGSAGVENGSTAP